MQGIPVGRDGLCARLPGEGVLDAQIEEERIGARIGPDRNGVGDTRDDLEAMTWIRDHTRPLDLVCAPDVPAARWIPALAARAVSIPMRPGWPQPQGPCAVRMSLSGRLPRGVESGPAPAFRAGTAAVWTNSENQ